MGAACIHGLCGPVPVELAVTTAPAAVAVDAANVYWTSSGPQTPGASTSGSVNRIPIAGGTVTALATGRNTPAGLAVDATSVYWVEGGSGGAGADPATVNKVPVGGGPVTTLASGLRDLVGIAVDTENVYFTRSTFVGPGVSGDVYDSAVSSVPIGGGNVTVLASTGVYQPSAIAVDGTSVYWIDAGDRSSQHGGVFKIPVGGGAPTALDSNQFYGRGLAVDASTVYFATTRGLSKVSKLGGGGVVLAALQNGGPASLAVDSGSVLFTVNNAFPDACGGNSGTGALDRIALGGGPAATLAAQGIAPGAITVDATNVYWADSVGNRVYKLAK